ncbi:uncharacterized protein LOC144618429 [Crassostrea virginica]
MDIKIKYLGWSKNNYRCAFVKAPPSERRLASLFSNILQRHFSVDVKESFVLCNKCRHKCRKIKEAAIKKAVLSKKVVKDDLDDDPTFASPKRAKRTTVSSPPSVPLPISSSLQSHGFCFVCKKPGPKLISVSHHARLLVFIRREVIIPSGARCCASHLQNGKMNDEAIHRIKTSDSTTLNKTTILSLIKL